MTMVVRYARVSTNSKGQSTKNQLLELRRPRLYYLQKVRGAGVEVSFKLVE
jgi:hypothetical protein